MPGTMLGMSVSNRSKILATLGAGMGTAVLAIMVGTGGNGTIPQEEGRRLAAYRDPIGIPTICEGWTHGVRMGDRATNAQCDELTLRGIDQALQVFMRHVPQDVRERMPAETVAAFLSFIYNVGPGKKGVKDGFVVLKNGRTSTMLRLLQAGDVAGSCRQLPHWVTAGGKRPRGLEARRQREMADCLRVLHVRPDQVRQLWHGPAPQGDAADWPLPDGSPEFEQVDDLHAWLRQQGHTP